MLRDVAGVGGEAMEGAGGNDLGFTTGGDVAWGFGVWKKQGASSTHSCSSIDLNLPEENKNHKSYGH